MKKRENFKKKRKGKDSVSKIDHRNFYLILKGKKKKEFRKRKKEEGGKKVDEKKLSF